MLNNKNPLNYNPSRVFKNLKYLKGLLPEFTEIFDHPVLTFFSRKNINPELC